MKVSVKRGLTAATCLFWLAGCETTSTAKLTDIFKPPEMAAAAPGDVSLAAASATAGPETTGSLVEVGPTGGVTNATPEALLGGDPYDDLSMAKRFFRDGNFGLAERYFRRAAEAKPRDAEAWLGLAATYDRLKRFALADRAYGEVLRLVGPTADVLNNIGYSYMLRGDYARARQKLEEAIARDPNNMYARTNLELLEQSRAERKAIR